MSQHIHLNLIYPPRTLILMGGRFLTSPNVSYNVVKMHYAPHRSSTPIINSRQSRMYLATVNYVELHGIYKTTWANVRHNEVVFLAPFFLTPCSYEHQEHPAEEILPRAGCQALLCGRLRFCQLFRLHGRRGCSRRSLRRPYATHVVGMCQG